MTIYRRFVENVKLRRFFVLLSVVLVLYLARSMITTILLTFIFTYLSIRLVKVVQRFIGIKTSVISLLLYGSILALLYFVLTKYVPLLLRETLRMVDSAVDFYESQPAGSNQLVAYIQQYIQRSDFMDQLKGGANFVFGYLQVFGELAFAFAMSFLLSFFYMIELDKMKSFTRLFLTSEFDWYFKDLYYFAKKFIETFGVVLEAQFFIAVVNTVLTLIGLSVMGFHQLPSLGLMVFCFSLIPVAGVIISCVPLSFIAYSQGGLNDLIFVLVMILVIHLLEAYVLNPKFMSSRTELPIFYTFVILLVAERLFGVWGLIVGIPVFTFFLDILRVKAIPEESGNGE